MSWVQLMVFLINGFVLSTSGLSIAFNEPSRMDYDLGSSFGVGNSNAFNFEDFAGQPSFEGFGAKNNDFSYIYAVEPRNTVHSSGYVKEPEAYDDDDSYEEYIPDNEILNQYSVPLPKGAKVALSEEEFVDNYLPEDSHHTGYEDFEQIHEMNGYDNGYGVDYHNLQNHAMDHEHELVKLPSWRNTELSRGGDFAHRPPFHRLPNINGEFHLRGNENSKKDIRHQSRFHDSYVTDKYGNEKGVHAGRHDEGGVKVHGKRFENKSFKIHQNIERPYDEVRKRIFARKLGGKEHRGEHLNVKKIKSKHQLSKREGNQR